MRSFFKVFHTSRCVFSVLLFAQELRNEERHSRLFGRGGGGTWWISNRVGEESYLGPFDVDVDFLSFLFFFRDIGRCTRFFRSHYVTWNTMATCRMNNIFSETIYILFFFLLFHFSMRHTKDMFRLQTQMYVQSVEEIFVHGGGKKDR